MFIIFHVSKYLRTVYRMHGVEFVRETIYCDLVRFRFAVLVIDATLFEPEMIISI